MTRDFIIYIIKNFLLSESLSSQLFVFITPRALDLVIGEIDLRSQVIV